MRRDPVPEVTILVSDRGQHVMPETDAVCALALLAQWAVRRAQRSTKRQLAAGLTIVELASYRPRKPEN